jgi:hypothetical protein
MDSVEVWPKKVANSLSLSRLTGFFYGIGYFLT